MMTGENTEVARQALELCWAIEKFPASEHQTETSLKAVALRESIEHLEQKVRELHVTERKWFRRAQELEGRIGNALA